MVQSAVDRAWEHYRSALEQLASLDNGAGEVASPAEHNQLVNELRSHRSALGSSAVGRAAVEGLLTNPRAVVRLWAASDALAWNEQAARPVLEELRDSPDVGLHATSAKYTLREFDRVGWRSDRPLMPQSGRHSVTAHAAVRTA